MIKNDSGDVSLIARKVLMLIRPPQRPVTDSSAQKSFDDEIGCAAIPVGRATRCAVAARDQRRPIQPRTTTVSRGHGAPNGPVRNGGACHGGAARRGLDHGGPVPDSRTFELAHQDERGEEQRDREHRVARR